MNMLPELSKLISDAVMETLEDRIAVAFSGGVDSSLIATIAKNNAETELFTAGVAGAQDIWYAETVAKELRLPLIKCVMDEREVIEIYKECYKICPLDFLKAELLVPVYRIAKEAKERRHTAMLFGSGSEELFIGYEKHYAYAKTGGDLNAYLQQEYKELQKKEIAWISKVCRCFGIEARFPFYNSKLAQYVFNIPLELRMEGYELKKGILREAATFLGVPQIAVKRKKKALQYGSGIHKILLRQKDLPGMKTQAPNQ